MNFLQNQSGFFRSSRSQLDIRSVLVFVPSLAASFNTSDWPTRTSHTDCYHQSEQKSISVSSLKSRLAYAGVRNAPTCYVVYRWRELGNSGLYFHQTDSCEAKSDVQGESGTEPRICQGTNIRRDFCRTVNFRGETEIKYLRQKKSFRIPMRSNCFLRLLVSQSLFLQRIQDSICNLPAQSSLKFLSKLLLSRIRIDKNRLRSEAPAFCTAENNQIWARLLLWSLNPTVTSCALIFFHLSWPITWYRLHRSRLFTPTFTD